MNYIIMAGASGENRYKFHEHVDYEIIIFSSGQGKININGSESLVEKGDIVIVPPKTKHSSLSYKNLQYISIMGNKDGLIRLERPLVIKDNENGDGLCLMKMILAHRYVNEDFVDTLCRAEILFVLKNININGQIENAVIKIKNRINTDFYDRTFNVTEILHNSGYAEDYIRSYFKKITGKSPIEFLNETRINNAKILIELYKKSMSLYEIALQCGFDDYIYFSRKFKEITGTSPQQYKKSLEKI